MVKVWYYNPSSKVTLVAAEDQYEVAAAAKALQHKTLACCSLAQSRRQKAALLSITSPDCADREQTVKVLIQSYQLHSLLNYY